MATTVVYAAIIGLLILLTYLETSLLQPHRSQRQGKRPFRPAQRQTDSDPEPPERNRPSGRNESGAVW